MAVEDWAIVSTIGSSTVNPYTAAEVAGLNQTVDYYIPLLGGVTAKVTSTTVYTAADQDEEDHLEDIAANGVDFIVMVD